MKKHTKIYLDYFGFNDTDFIPCEVCQSKAVDIHHIDNKGMGGSKTKDYIENLISLCRFHHIAAHKEQLTKEYLSDIHKIKLENG